MVSLCAQFLVLWVWDGAVLGISSKFPGDADTSGLGTTTLRDPLSERHEVPGSDSFLLFIGHR